MTERTLKTIYFGPGRGKPVVKTTRSSRRDEALPSVCRHMTQNDYGATVASVHDEETGELLLVVTYKMGERLQVVFEGDVKNPVCITDIEE
ncbi:MAG: hypothetical protein ACXW1D_00400 [Halobacteriota archaeon]